MTPWCAWCQCYLGTLGTQPGMTHSICSSCADQQFTGDASCKGASASRGEPVCQVLSDCEAPLATRC